MATQPEQARKAIGDEVWWHVRLAQYRTSLLSVWNVLTFDRSMEAGAGLAAWAFVHGIILLACQLEGGVVYVLGNLLLMAAVAHYLIRMAVRYCHRTVSPQWTESQEQQFVSVCGHIAFCQRWLLFLWQGAVEARKSQPKKFYLFGFLVVFVLARTGYWIPTAYILHLLASFLLLLPPALRYGWLSETSVRQLWPVAVAVGEKARSWAKEAVRQAQQRWKELSQQNQQHRHGSQHAQTRSNR